MTMPALDLEEVPSQFPPADLPTVFCDGFSAYAHSPQFVKLYLARVDPSLNATGKSQLQVIQQLVMPIPGVVNALAFFEVIFGRLREQGFASDGDLEAARASFRDVPK